MALKEDDEQLCNNQIVQKFIYWVMISSLMIFCIQLWEYLYWDFPKAGLGSRDQQVSLLIEK